MSKLDALPKAFIWRRLHSLSGMWLVLFLIEHLVTNSQAALLLGENGQGFVRMVNLLHNLPYLTVIEVMLLGVPILIHMIWGIRYALTSKSNVRGDGTKPSLKYNRNRAYSWQRITSWILVVLLTVHVVKFRFIDYPGSVNVGTVQEAYYLPITMDEGLYTVAPRLDVTLYDQEQIASIKQTLPKEQIDLDRKESTLDPDRYKQRIAVSLERLQKEKLNENFDFALSKAHLKEGEVLAVAKSFGTISLLGVRNTFKSPIWVGIYTIFVLSACFHAFNGLWTSMLTWGWVIRASSQTRARRGAIILMIAIAFCGLIAVWGTYFWNLNH